MRKLIAPLLALVICLSLCGCKSEEAAHVEELITAIGEVTADSALAIREAETAFAALPEEEWPRVENAQLLIDARAAYEALFTPVDITMENWSEYFELSTQPVWRETADGQATQLREVRTFRVKDAYKDRIIGADTSLTLHFDIASHICSGTVDWTARTYTEGPASQEEHLRPGTASYAWPGTATTDAEEAAKLTELHIGYSVLSNPKTDAPNTKLFVFDHTLSGIEGKITLVEK